MTFLRSEPPAPDSDLMGLFLHLFFFISTSIWRSWSSYPCCGWIPVVAFWREEPVSSMVFGWLLVGWETVPSTVLTALPLTLPRWLLAFSGPSLMWWRLFEQDFWVFRGEILSVGTQLLMKAPVCDGDFLLWMIRWSIHIISEGGVWNVSEMMITT